MTKTKKIWMDGEFVDWDKANIHVINHSLHYGSAVFEGIRAYPSSAKSTKGKPAVFRLNEHVERFFFSAKTMGMKLPYTREEISNAITELIKVNKLDGCYIRPIAFYGDKMGLSPIDAPVHVAIAVWTWGAYLSKEKVSIIISKYIRIHPQSSVMDAKISGHYINSILTSLESHKAKADEALLLDFDGNIAEGPGENIFFIKGKVLYTPQTGTILPGITRDTIFELAKDLGYKIVEKKIQPKDIPSFEEAFFCGTAAEVCSIEKIDNYTFKTVSKSKEIQKSYMDIVHDENARYKKYLTFVD